MWAPYTLYTGLSLGLTFKAFLSLFLLHLLLIILVKIHTSEIIKKAGRFEILRHCLENMNIPIPFEDFEVSKGCRNDYRRRRRSVIIEMSALMIVNLIFNVLMQTPLIYTGQPNNKLETRINLFCAGFKIISRHQLLQETIGTVPEENHSYKTALLLMVLWPLGVVLCSALEMVGYFLYLKVTVVSMPMKWFVGNNDELL